MVNVKRSIRDIKDTYFYYGNIFFIKSKKEKEEKINGTFQCVETV